VPTLQLSAPLIGLGASASIYYPAVAALCGAESAIPGYADVANAVGAVVGRVEVKVEVSILSPDGDRYEVMAAGAPAVFTVLSKAKAHAEKWAREEAMARAKTAGADTPDTALFWHERRATVEAREVLIEARLIATASGRPQFALDQDRTAEL